MQYVLLFYVLNLKPVQQERELDQNPPSQPEGFTYLIPIVYGLISTSPR